MGCGGADSVTTATDMAVERDSQKAALLLSPSPPGDNYVDIHRSDLGSGRSSIIVLVFNICAESAMSRTSSSRTWRRCGTYMPKLTRKLTSSASACAANIHLCAASSVASNFSPRSVCSSGWLIVYPEKGHGVGKKRACSRRTFDCRARHRVETGFKGSRFQWHYLKAL